MTESQRKFVEAYVTNMYAFFKHPKNQGPAFTWDTFPDMVYIGGLTMYSVSCAKPPTPEEEEIVATACRKKARQMIK